MIIKVVVEGKIKEPCFKLGVDEFKKRLTGYASFSIVETSSITAFLKNNVKPQSFVITLEIEGEELSSPEFAKKIREIELDGAYNEIIFLIGGSNGLEESIRASSNFKLSMSKMTFLHQEAVLILTEQIYRAYKILNNETYHK